MRLDRTLSISLCIVISATCVFAETAGSSTSAASSGTAESVMTHIPAGAMGFVAVNNIQITAANAERFLTEIGLAPMLGLQPAPGGLVEMLRGAAQLNSGFNPDAGFAAVMLDPQQFGVDLVKMVSPMSPPPDPNQPQQQIPFVLIVPGSSVEGVFGSYPIEQAGDYSLVKLRMGEMYATKCGSYIALSPTPKALDAILSAKTKVTSELTDSEKAKIAAADVTLHLNMKVGGPIYARMLTEFEQMGTMMGQMKGSSGAPSADILKMYFNIYRDMLMALDSTTLTGKFATTGLVLNTQLTWNTKTAMGKMMASLKPSRAKLLDKLPNLPYVLAFGIDYGQISEEMKQFSRDFMDKFLADESMAKVPAEAKSKLRLATELGNEQFLGAQFVIGGPAPEGPGVFGASYVLKCKDSAVFKDMLLEVIPAYNLMLKSMMGDDAADQAFSLSYLRNAETVNGTPVDAIDISFPRLENMSEGERGDFSKAMGEDKLRLRVATADKNTLVMTMGGGQAFLKEAIKAAQTEGAIKADADVVPALKHMPKNRLALMLFNASNLMEVITKATMIMDPDSPPPPFMIATKTPITIGIGVTGNESEIAMYVPNSLIKEVAGMIMMFLPMPQGGPGAPETAPSPGNEF